MKILLNIENYELFEQIAQPLLTNDAYYIKYTTPGFMDLNVEIIDDDRFAMAHNYELNGDLMADPDMEFTVVKKTDCSIHNPINRIIFNSMNAWMVILFVQMNSIVL